MAKFTSDDVRRFVTARLFLGPVQARLATSRLMTDRQRTAYLADKNRRTAELAARAARLMTKDNPIPTNPVTLTTPEPHVPPRD